MGMMSFENKRPGLELHFLKGQTKAIVCLRGHLTSHTVDQLARLAPKLGDPRLIELDLSDLSVIDEAGVRALRFFERRCSGKGSLLILSHPRPGVRRSLSSAGVRSVLAPTFLRRRVTSVTALPTFNPESPQAG
jgi:anti-anti-sigma factor